MLKLKCIFVSDLHGKVKRYEKLFKIIQNDKLDGVFIGGDILPNESTFNRDMNDFIKDKIFLQIKKIDKNIRFFIILGNDDPRVYEEKFIDASNQGFIDYVHNGTVKFNGFFITGYSYVPPTPFQLKDWEKYDVSRFVDVGVVPPEEGQRTIKISKDIASYSTISQDLEKLAKNAPVKKTIFLFHSPPYKSNLDRACLDYKMVDYAPVDVNVGSIAIRRFIEKKQPLLTLHGHVHESVRLTGKWRDKIGNTFCFSAAHDGDELAVVIFDTSNLENATRLLV